MSHAGQKRSHMQLETSEAQTTPTTTSASPTTATATADLHLYNPSQSPPIAIDRMEISDEKEDASDVDEEDETTEYVIVSMPASLVKQLQQRTNDGTDTVQIQNLNSQQPFFHVPFALPAATSNVKQTNKDTLSSTVDSPQPTPSPPTLAPPSLTQFVGTYEYSIGTNLLWRIKNPTNELGRNAISESSQRSTTPTISSPTITSRHSPRLIPLTPSNAVAAAPSTINSANSNAGAAAGPQIELLGKTWKRLVFSRVR